MARQKRLLGVLEAVESCHTARIGGYVIEGHVPMDGVDRLMSTGRGLRASRHRACQRDRPAWQDPKARSDVLSFGDVSTAPGLFYRAGRE